MSDQAHTLVRRLFEDINSRCSAAQSELIASGHVYRAHVEKVRGVAGLDALHMMYYRGFPDLELTIDDMFGSGGRVATAFSFTGTHLGEMMGVPATGRRVSVHGTIHSRVEHGRIVEEWELLDLATMYQQLGETRGAGL